VASHEAHLIGERGSGNWCGRTPGRPQGGDRVGALHARDRARCFVDDPPAACGIVVAVQAPGPARARCAQPGRRGRTAGDQSRRRFHTCLRQGAGAQTARPAGGRTRLPGCATARSCRSGCRSGCAAPRSRRSRSAICTRSVKSRDVAGGEIGRGSEHLHGGCSAREIPIDHVHQRARIIDRVALHHGALALIGQGDRQCSRRPSRGDRDDHEPAQPEQDGAGRLVRMSTDVRNRSLFNI
jgi:hypothetical protein